MSDRTHPPNVTKHSQDDDHIHLDVLAQRPSKWHSWRWERWGVVGLGICAVACFAASYFKPWWTFLLYAPQYPRGLTLIISLTGMAGDVHEIDLLNHYIGMKHLSDAASLERHLAGYGVGAICVTSLALLIFAGKKLNAVVAIPAIAFPLIFLADSFYWLYSFGHSLDPKAPLNIGAFTPQLFGNGKIGQFETFASPAIGFWLALCGVCCAIVGSILRTRLCAYCNRAGKCSAVCPRILIRSPQTSST